MRPSARHRRPALLALALILGGCLSAPSANAFSGGPPPGRAGEPPNNRDCTGCHDSFNVNQGDVTLSLLDVAGMPFRTYDAGIVHDLTIEVTSGQAGRARWGFELIPMTGDVLAGELTAGASSALIPAGALTYIAHAPAIRAPDGGTWEFSWTAPMDGSDVTFYACGNAANDDRDTDGDYIECTTFVVSPPSAGGLLRVARWMAAVPGENSAVFSTAPCSVPSTDIRACDETTAMIEDFPGPLPMSVPGDGTLVFLEYDSDTTAPGSADSIEVRKDSTQPGGLLVTVR